MNELYVYPTSRALREVSTALKERQGFLPTLMRMDEFEKRLLLLGDKSQVDTLQRTIYLQEAAAFEAFKNFKIDLDLVRFFTRSDAIFKFFEELAAEQVEFGELVQADAYAEFDKHLEILEELQKKYFEILDNRGLTDKMFIPKNYEINKGFIQNYEKIEIFLEGYLSYFELKMLSRAAEHTTLHIHYVTSKFNQKMQERFKAYGIELPKNSFVTVDLSAKRVVDHTYNPSRFNASIYSVAERLEQVALAFEKIEELVVQKGIKAENIVLILPDERFKTHFKLYDKLCNLNFSMGFDYSEGKTYKTLQALYGYWRSGDEELLRFYGFDLEMLHTVSASKKCGVEEFMQTLQKIDLLDVSIEENNERFYEQFLVFKQIFREERLSSKEWLFMWLKVLEGITIDDVRGGKVTVMGVLETRGVSFDGVIIVDFNDGIVPASSSKDQFLNSSVRAFAGLPTKKDREFLQKQYYKRLLEQAKEVVLIYATGENALPSRFLYELGLNGSKEASVDLSLLYDQDSQLKAEVDPFVESFDATKITWSSSRLKTFLSCKRKYYYTYIEGIKEKEEKERNEGTILHELLEKLFSQNEYFESIEAMQTALFKLLDEIHNGDNAKSYYQRLLWKEKLKGFIESQVAHFKAGWRIVLKEQEFYCNIGGLNFKGRIDRIDQDSSHTLVLDYKSGKTDEAQRTKNLEKLTDFQMSIYHELLKEKYKNINLAYVKLFENGNIEEIKALQEKTELLYEHIAALKTIKSFEASKCEELKVCEYCEFQLLCQRGEYL